MAKITADPNDATPTTDDLVLTVDTTSGSNRKVTIANLATTVLAQATLPTLGWYTPSGTISAVAYNGNRSYSLTTSADQSATMSPGNRLRTTRTIAAPTQCTDLESGLSIYYNKTSPNKTTFTDDFVCSAWVKLESIGSAMSIESRYNGTSGWDFLIASTGQVQLTGYNAGAANFSYVLSNGTVPIGRWVHIAAQLDMSTFTATTTTSYVMIDGLDTPAVVARGGTNPTALVQAGNLEIGGRNGGLQPFDGKLAQVAYYSAKVTQANVKATIAQKLSGSETSLASAYSFSNSITDLNTTTPNDLTAQNSAVATSADSPFGGQAGGTISSTLDYAIIQTVSASTLVVQVPEGCTIPTTGGVSSFVYARDKTPFGFPAQQDKWSILMQANTTDTQTSPVNGTWYNPGPQNITFPIGIWDISWQGQMIAVSNATQTQLSIFGTLSTANNSESDSEFSAEGMLYGASGSLRLGYSAHKRKFLTLAAATVYYLNIKTGVGSQSSIGYEGAVIPTRVQALNAYL